MKLTVSLDAEANTASVVFEGADGIWTEIRRDLQATSDEVVNNSARSLTMPWWAYLNARRTLDYRVKKHGIKVLLDPGAEEQLLKVRDRDESYARALRRPEVASGVLSVRLKKSGFLRELKPYQLRNVKKLSVLPAGASFSVPGAGKTSEALAYYFLRRRPESKLLVVCPKNAFATWTEQLVACTKDKALAFSRLEGGRDKIAALLERAPEFAVMSYQQVPTARDIIGKYLGQHPGIVFLDESHRIKRGETGEIGSFVLSISYLPEAKLILSGTPMPNSIEDLVPQFKFLRPEVATDSSQVATQIKALYVRTTKKELALPPVKRVSISVEMGVAQRKLYELMRSEEARTAEAALRTRDKAGFRALGRSAIRLLQVASNPGLLAKIPIPHEELVREMLAEGDSPKIRYVCNRARSLVSQGKKVLIWTTFVENVELIAARLKDIGADYIHGGVETGNDEEAQTRENKIKLFHIDKSRMVLVANPAACSESISLHTVCHNAIYVDRNYNAAQYMQSEDRIHRLGLAKSDKTVIEILSAPDSIDVSVDRRLRRKVNAMGIALNDDSVSIDPISFDPDQIDNSDDLDPDDAADFIQHLKGH